MGQEKERFLRKGDACIVATDLVGKSDCFSDIWCSWKLTHSFIPNSFDVSGIDTDFKSWIFSLKQGETIRTYKLLFFIPVPQAEEQEGAKKVGRFPECVWFWGSWLSICELSSLLFDVFGFLCF